jgi:hypothetical protein
MERKNTFSVSIDGVDLDPTEVDRIARAVRTAALFEMSKLRLEERGPARLGDLPSAVRCGCGGGCQASAELWPLVKRAVAESEDT